MRVCVISSGNGGAFKAFCRLTGVPASHVLIVTDRPCGIERFAAEQGITHVRLPGGESNQRFSERAAAEIDRFGGVDVVFLLFTRLVTAALFERFTVVNFHPSLLPAFPGFHAISRAIAAGVKFVGTTMHVVDASVDGGRILAQSVRPVSETDDVRSLSRAAFFHKVHFMLLVAEHFGECGASRLDFSDWPVGTVMNPELRTPKFRDAYAAIGLVDEETDASPR